MRMMDKKPDLAILIGHALAKKGKAMHDPMPDAEDEDGPASGKGDADEESEHMEEVMTDFLKAVQDKDPKAMADLFKEAFECCESYPHDET